MNFLSNLADSIPVVGHVKGIVHYATGDTEGGNKAMYQATRTTAVLGAGAAGSLAGPGGAVIAAMYAGAITDGVATVAMDKPQGLVKGCSNIADDINEGKNPMGSIASTGFQVGMDGLGGLGMGGVSSAASQVTGKTVAKGAESIAKTAVKTVGEKTLEKTVKMTGEEVVKTVTKTVTEKAVKKAIETAAVQAEIALVSTHVCMQADERTKEEESQRRDRERREREERQRRERAERQQQEQRAREQEQRERQAREQQEQRAREQEQQERQAREQQEQRAREQEQRAREQEQQERQAREQQEQRAREQEQQAREQEQQERQAREQQEQRAREQEQRAREQEQRAREQEQQERQAREQQEQRAREQEQRERQAREQQEQRAREQEQQERQAREQQEQRERQAREQQEQRAREQEQQERQAREQQEQRTREQLQQRVREKVQQSSTPESNSGSSQPPQGNGNNNNQPKKKKPNYFAIFKNLLEELLDIVFGVERPYARICISQIFQRLSKAQKDYLGKIIERLYNDDILIEVLMLVIRMFAEYFPGDISFLNFLSLTEFVAVYIQEEIEYRTEVFRMDEQISIENDSSFPIEEFENLRTMIISSIMNLPDIVSIISDIFARLRFDIESELMPFQITENLLLSRELSSNFRDVFSGIYHYFKHRCVPGDGVLSVREYYDWIRRVLEELGRHKDYRDLLQDRSTETVTVNVRFEVYVPLFDRRIRIIVKVHRNSDSVITVLASCFVIDNPVDGDEEGDVFIFIPPY